MRYIRTKDGRIIDLTSKQVSSYEIIDDKTAVDEYGEDSGFICVYYFNSDIGEHIEYDNKGGHSMDNWYLKDIIKQADTILDLCDEYIYENIYGEHKRCFLTQFNVWLDWESNGDEELSEEEVATIKGAIWTDKGLIYVAKMNDERDLELLWG